MPFFSNISKVFGPKDTKQAKQTKTRKKSKKQAKKPQPKQTRKPKPQKRQPRINAKQLQELQKQLEQKKQEMQREAEAQAREILVEAKGNALQIRQDAEEQARRLRQSLEDQQRSLDTKLSNLDKKLDNLDKKEETISKAREDLEKNAERIRKTKEKILETLEDVSGMTKQEAREFLLENLEKKLNKEMAKIVRQKEEKTREEADEKAREIIIDAMRYGATDYVPEYTLSVVKIKSEDIKGRVIGKGGRNIHSFEKVTGVDLDLDAAPDEVRLSSFDPVRREIARITLEKLIKDGRIHPTNIEETHAKVKKDIDKILFEEGKKLCHAVSVYNLPKGLVQMLGRFKYRFSYGQNMISHTLEETRIGIKLASEMGADVDIVKLGCLLHDIGKVSDNPEGSHVDLGVQIAQKYRMPQPVIDCIAQHHEDEPFTGVEQMLVYIADAISGARPGARYENYEEYVARLEKLEEIATSYKGVEQAYAIQAGREVRVILNPEQSKDEDVIALSHKIKDRIKNEMTYPGTVTVNVIREFRARDVAK